MKTFFKPDFCYKFVLKAPAENSKDPMFKLINSYDMIKEIYINYKKDNKKFFYFNKDKLHKLLYDLEEMIKINDDSNTLLPDNNMSELFYFELLVLDNRESINYTYSITIIREINNSNKNISFKLKKIIISKIILSLIYNFKGSDDFDEENLDEINQIENENNDIINNNLEIFKEFNCNYSLNTLKDSKVDRIYLDIFISLLKLNKSNDYNYYENILKELNIESIYITNTIFEGLSEELDVEKNEFLNEFMINDVDDLKNDKLINFYYIIIVKILKSPIYISKNGFLEKNRINLMKVLKNSKDKKEILKLSSNSKDKIRSILKLIYNDYFYEKYFNDQNVEISEDKEKDIIINNQFKENADSKSEINKYSKSNINDELKEDKKLNDENRFLYKEEEKEEPNETIENENQGKLPCEIADKIMNYSVIIINIDKDENGGPSIKKERIFYSKDKFEIQRKDLLENGNYDELNDEDKKNKNAHIIYKNYKKFLAFLTEVEECIINSDIKFNPRIELILEKQIEKNHGENKDYYDILCTSRFINQIDENRLLEFIDRNILINGIGGKCNGFMYLINELSNEDYENETFRYED